MRTIGVEERRARLARRHRLAPAARLDDPVDIARDLVGLHASDPASVYVSAAARMRTPALEPVEHALYEVRKLVRLLGMRRTMFVLPLDLAAIVQAACAGGIAARQRRRLETMIDDAGLHDDPAAHVREVEQATLAALEARGEATGAELSREIAALRQEVLIGQGTKWEGAQRLTTWMLVLLGAEGRIVRGRPRGSWISSQYRWAPLESWLPGGLEEWDVDAAQAELARRWLASYGPATLSDLRWWTGWTVGVTKRALAQVETAEVDLDGEPGLVLADDLEPIATPEPWVALLPGLDPTVMGWKRREWYLGPHAPALFDTAGNAGPTVWCDGRIVGGWGQPESGEVAFRLLEDVAAEARAAIEAEAERLRAWLGGVRVSQRFGAPLVRELSV
ncbi:MAG: winged helix DNA-binding domain-containing protein [Gaiellaceae bacterium]